MGCAGGIDLGGTKIEATIFDENWQPVNTRRIPTPRDNYEDLIAAIAGQAQWMNEQVDGLLIGIGIPGLHNKQTGLAFTSNLPATGRPFRDDLVATIGRKVVFGNDCDLFSYSEAVLGAGIGSDTVFGLILGTGIGGGVCYGATLLQTFNGAAGEVGHMAVSGNLVQEFNLPILTCGCGHKGCYETLASGPGMTKLARVVMDAELAPDEIAAQAAKGEIGAVRVMEIWLRIVAELIANLQVTIDPDCIVLGGGLSNIPDIAQSITRVLPQAMLPGIILPKVTVAKYGDSSGTRGAALAALLGNGGT